MSSTPRASWRSAGRRGPPRAAEAELLFVHTLLPGSHTCALRAQWPIVRRMPASTPELKAGPAEKIDEAILGPTVWLENQTLIAAPALGLTAYLADTVFWAHSGAQQALELFLSV